MPRDIRFNRRARELADFITANFNMPIKEVQALFCSKWGIPKTNYYRIHKRAKELVVEEQEALQRGKLAIMESVEVARITSRVLSKLEAEEILSDIARCADNDSDKVKAISQLARMEGWDVIQMDKLPDFVQRIVQCMPIDQAARVVADLPEAEIVEE